VIATLAIGAVAGTLAQTVCYPLDTIRRRMQMGKHYKHSLDAVIQIYRKESAMAFFKGYVPNSLKVVPNNAIRFLVYEVMKRLLNIKHGSTDT